ncbi:MAG TPA: NAD(P)H-hydrate dehydratase [Mycobacteriales bacterium]|nr:NAD(P)H-hydrate dehydratase [Mycobacteriales bacterium]
MTEPELVDGVALRQRWPLPDPRRAEDKNDRGSVTVIGGSVSTPGAPLLAGLAALRAGAGRLTVATVASTAVAAAVALPEAAVIGLPETGAGALSLAAAAAALDAAERADVVLLGPGMRAPESARRFVAELLDRLPREIPVVLDALALTCEALTGETARPALILTPNATEADMLLEDSSGSAGDDGDRAAAIARRFQAVVVLGSTVASASGQMWRTPKGNSGLGTSGSGDVLAGAIAGFAARGATPTAAALWGLTAHAGAGDRLAHRVGAVGYLARELLDELPRVVEQ